MAIRDKFRRAVGSSRKSTTSTSSSSSTQAAETATLASTTESESSSTINPTDSKNRTRAFTWRSSKPAEERDKPKKSKKKQRGGPPDPREKPFNEMNLRYQEIFCSFELTFGTSRPEQLWNPDGELSPGTSRQNSLDLGRQ